VSAVVFGYSPHVTYNDVVLTTILLNSDPALHFMIDGPDATFSAWAAGRRVQIPCKTYAGLAWYNLIKGHGAALQCYIYRL
jgi:hypothetical protein